MYEEIEAHYRDNFNRLVTKFAPRYGTDEAKDIVQNAYTDLMIYRSTGAKIDDVQGFLFSSIIRDAVNNYKRDTRRTEIEEDHAYVYADPHTDIERQYEIKEEIDVANDRISQVKNERARRILRLKFTTEDSNSEVARIVGCSNEYVSQVIRKFRKEMEVDDS